MPQSMQLQKMFRYAAVLAVLLAGSCTSDSSDKPVPSVDPVTNHPISVEPQYQALKLAPGASLSSEDAIKLQAFVDDYLARGNGAISISVPPGAESAQTIAQLGERLAQMGVPKSHILVGVQDQGASDGRVEIGYISYAAHTKRCGDWSMNAADTADNLAMPDFGCAVQQNIAAQVADPRDLGEPKPMAPADATRRMQVLSNYEHAQTTSAQKTQAQSGAVSEVGSSGGSQ